jgi:hypothetical protein
MVAEKIDGCELSEAARFTPRYHEDEICWNAASEVCDVPMVVWNGHGTEPPEEELTHMLEHLDRVASAQFGPDGYKVDRNMRQIPTHFHAHARDHDWWARRFRR